ncbi:E3 ubiquitin-protein ligase AMFR-like [Ruditapes philippinarum]|uniref:E3 ubiquitin-protein ligase AMFR-like n=1 Tax=Ruditapes philippinarum TaxID=129788 RepID=UPI00295AA307|nr:E3 ubiquitin-protein ligase AMFR-like [Ruditapes philippinarum]
MPVILLERIPLPSLRAYTGFSVILLACAVFYAHQVVQTAQTDGLQITENPNDENDNPQYMNVSLPYDHLIWNMVYVLTAEAWCVWTLVNTAYCCLILLGKLVQKVVFGELRVSEQQHLKDKFWNFLFYKFIFVFGVMNVQTMEEVVLWVAWFTVLGFFHLLTQLAKDRFEYVSFSPTTPRFIHIKLLSLLCVIVISCCGLLAVCAIVGLQMGLTIFAFMAAECMLLAIRTLYVVARYCLHLIDMNLEGVWENRATYVYYTELIFELAALSIDFGHHLHMLLWGNIFLSMASLVICMQLRYLFYEVKRRIKRHKNYRRVIKNMEERFSMATVEELNNNDDDCAVCWEKMETARKLPCGHLFHNSCLRSWLEQDTSCPTCRLSLNERPTGVDPNGNIPDRPVLNANIPPANTPGNMMTNHFFHFDGSRYVSWLPSFSVEVTHTNMLANNRPTPAQSSQLDNMARQVLQVFPHMPLNVVMDDLRITRSVDFTIENILEGRLQAPPPGSMISRALEDEDSHSDDSENYQFGATRPDSSDFSADFPEYLSIPNETGDNNSTDTTDRSDSLAQFSGRFSKSANERESMLEDRKNSMLEQARRRLLAKEGICTDSSEQTLTSNTSTNTLNTVINQPSTSALLTDSTSDSVRQRRELAYMAATRRQQQGMSDT